MAEKEVLILSLPGKKRAGNCSKAKAVMAILKELRGSTCLLQEGHINNMVVFSFRF